MKHKLWMTCLTLTIVTITMFSTLAQNDEDIYSPPADLPEGWYARIETSMGRIVARLLPEQAPQSVAHFAALAEGRLEWFDRITGELRKGPYYNGIKVHRSLAGRHFEAGDPQGTGRGAPDLFLAREGFGPITFDAPGRLGMTKDGPRISAVQFFATVAGEPWLSAQHPCFGVVISGLSVIQNISQVKTYSNARPIEPPVIETVHIFSVGEPPPLPDPEPHRPQREQFKIRPNMRRTEPSK